MFFPTQIPRSSPLLSQQSIPVPKAPLQYRVYSLDRSLVHTLTIPSDARFTVQPVVTKQLELVKTLALQHQAIAAINGGFFDPGNQRSTSYVMVRGKLVADPRSNPRLMSNPDLVPYLSKILNRTELRRYQCSSHLQQASQPKYRYTLVLHSASVSPDCELLDRLGAGPQLLPRLTLVEEGFLAYDTGKIPIRDPLGSFQPNARSAIGLRKDGSLVMMMAAQKPGMAVPSGMSLPELAEFMKTLGVDQAMNLDGGSSTSFYYQGKSFYGKLDETGTFIQRPVKSALILQAIN
ncbi:MAG: phosphodiester glycosidase family protein [Leptolyngbyaceae cyanobacterium bins.59]|nr:phosphodiester glycosidase family protein [Leptolyngbyaceae cyanobacterium bins.59]